MKVKGLTIIEEYLGTDLTEERYKYLSEETKEKIISDYAEFLLYLHSIFDTYYLKPGDERVNGTYGYNNDFIPYAPCGLSYDFVFRAIDKYNKIAPIDLMVDKALVKKYSQLSIFNEIGRVAVLDFLNENGIEYIDLRDVKSLDELLNRLPEEIRQEIPRRLQEFYIDKKISMNL